MLTILRDMIYLEELTLLYLTEFDFTVDLLKQLILFVNNLTRLKKFSIILPYAQNSEIDECLEFRLEPLKYHKSLQYFNIELKKAKQTIHDF